VAKAVISSGPARGGFCWGTRRSPGVRWRLVSRRLQLIRELPRLEIVESLAEVARDYGVYVEWSTNEKVALEVGMCVSMMGLRALVAMKHVGLNVASDLS